MNWATIPVVGFLVEPTLFGHLIIFSTAINVTIAIGTFGQQRTLLHYDVAHVQESQSAFLMALFFAALLIPFSFFSIVLLQGSLPPIIVCVSLLSIVHLLLSTQRRAFQDAKGFAYLRLSLGGLRFILVVGTLALGGSDFNYLLAEMAAIILSFILNIKTVLGAFVHPRMLSYTSSRTAVRIGLPVLCQTVLLMALSNYDKFLFGRYGLFEELGKFGMLFLIASSMAFVSAYLGMRYEPLIYQKKAVADIRFAARNYLKKLAMTQVVVGVALTAAYFILRFFAVFDQGVSLYVLPLLVVGQIFYATTIPFSNLLTRFRAVSLPIMSIFVATVLSVTLNTHLIPTYGSVGAAITFLVSNLLYLTLIALATRRLLDKSQGDNLDPD